MGDTTEYISNKDTPSTMIEAAGESLKVQVRPSACRWRFDCANLYPSLLENSTWRDRRFSVFTIYDWVKDDGRENLGKWIEVAAKQAGR